MRRAVIVVLGLALSGCSAFEDRNITKCEDAIKARLKAPSSYKRVSATDTAGIQVDIEYDAVNSFNAPIRGKAGCSINKDGTMALFPDLAT